MWCIVPSLIKIIKMTDSLNKCVKFPVKINQTHYILIYIQMTIPILIILVKEIINETKYQYLILNMYSEYIQYISFLPYPGQYYPRGYAVLILNVHVVLGGSLTDFVSV